MDQNQQTVDNDLQKAIDDITNTTNTDPVFSDPVAAPSSVPEGDTGELGEPVGPFPAPKPEIVPPAPKLEMVQPAPEPIAPLEAMAAVPELTIPEPPAPVAAPVPIPEPPKAPISQSLSTSEIKKAALRDLVPLLDRVNIPPEEKFNIYRNIFENLRDYTILDSAYRAAHDIPDDTKRAEALLYLVESIDKM